MYITACREYVTGHCPQNVTDSPLQGSLVSLSTWYKVFEILRGVTRGELVGKMTHISATSVALACGLPRRC